MWRRRFEISASNRKSCAENTPAGEDSSGCFRKKKDPPELVSLLGVHQRVAGVKSFSRLFMPKIRITSSVLCSLLSSGVRAFFRIL